MSVHPRQDTDHRPQTKSPDLTQALLGEPMRLLVYLQGRCITKKSSQHRKSYQQLCQNVLCSSNCLLLIQPGGGSL